MGKIVEYVVRNKNCYSNYNEMLNQAYYLENYKFEGNINGYDELINFLNSINTNYEFRLTKSPSGYKINIRYYDGLLHYRFRFEMKKPLPMFQDCIDLYVNSVLKN